MKFTRNEDLRYFEAMSLIESKLNPIWIESDSEEANDFTRAFEDGGRSWDDLIGGKRPFNIAEAKRLLVDDFMKKLNKYAIKSDDATEAIEKLEALLRDDGIYAKELFKAFLRTPTFEEESDETKVLIFRQEDAKRFISKTINDVLFEKDVNRIKVLEASIKEKFGKDWKDALVAQEVLDKNAADLFAQILEGLKNEEDVRLGVSGKTESTPIEAEKPKRGRKKKEPAEETSLVIEPEIEIEEPENNIDLGEIDDLLSDEDLGDLLEGIEDIDF